MLVLAVAGFIIGLVVATTVLMSIFTRWSSRVYDDRYQKMLEIIEQNSITANKQPGPRSPLNQASLLSVTRVTCVWRGKTGRSR